MMDNAAAASDITLNLDRIDRWNICQRLRELSVACRCESGQPLQVKIDTATTAIQIWSVVQHHTLARAALTERLERCWKQPVAR